MERDPESVLDYAVKMVNQIRFRPLNAREWACGDAAGWSTANKPEGCRFDSLWCHWNFSL